MYLEMIYYNLSLTHYRLATSSTHPFYFPRIALTQNNPVHTVTYRSVSGTHGPRVKKNFFIVALMGCDQKLKKKCNEKR